MSPTTRAQGYVEVGVLVMASDVIVNVFTLCSLTTVSEVDTGSAANLLRCFSNTRSPCLPRVHILHISSRRDYVNIPLYTSSL